ncbi:MAG: hypothetical protein R3F43_14855 [bacterium]
MDSNTTSSTSPLRKAAVSVSVMWRTVSVLAARGDLAEGLAQREVALLDELRDALAQGVDHQLDAALTAQPDEGLLDLTVEAAAHAAIAGEHEDGDAPHLRALLQQRVSGVAPELPDERPEHLAVLARVRLERAHRILRTLELCGAHQLHRARDLLGVVHRRDPLANVLQARHRMLPPSTAPIRRRRPR